MSSHSFQLYRVFFRDMDGNRHCFDHTKGVWLAKDGFWVNAEWQQSERMDDDKYWIPPSQIICMAKVGRTDD